MVDVNRLLTFWQEAHNQAPQTEQSKSRLHKPSIGGHKLHLPGHRHNRSHDEKQSGGFGIPLRASTSRENTANPMRSGSTAMSSALNLRSRATSPSPSLQSAQSRDNNIAQRSPSGREPKRSLFDRVTGRHKRARRSSAILIHNITTEPTATAQTQQDADGHRVNSTTFSAQVGWHKWRLELTEAIQTALQEAR
jgi:adenylate cyclase